MNTSSVGADDASGISVEELRGRGDGAPRPSRHSQTRRGEANHDGRNPQQVREEVLPYMNLRRPYHLSTTCSLVVEQCLTFTMIQCCLCGLLKVVAYDFDG